ncbi:hypothetical protein [Saccharopolyspora shandongensis]|uniref:hypothetical protein n=1 Tax=Saccharopolyspora shandongensis TaxID=418495 RepID=UPI0034094EF2
MTETITATVATRDDSPQLRAVRDVDAEQPLPAEQQPADGVFEAELVEEGAGS